MVRTSHNKNTQAPKEALTPKASNKAANILAFSKTNYILLAIGMAIIILGFILLSGNGSTPQAFDPEIFNARHTKVAPLVCLFGFLFIIVAIVYHKKDNTPAE